MMNQWQHATVYQWILRASTFFLIVLGAISLWTTPSNIGPITLVLLICLLGIWLASRPLKVQETTVDAPSSIFLEKATNASDIIQTFPLVVEKLKAGTNCELVTLIIFDTKKEWLTFAALDRPRSQLKQGMKLRIHDASASKRVLQGQPSLIPYLGDYLDYAIDKTLFDAGYRSQISLPLRVGDDIVGALTLSWKEAEAYNADLLPLISQIADTFSLAVERTRLLGWQQQQHQRSETLHQINHQISGSLELDEVLQTIARQVVELMNADFSNVMLFKPPNLLVWLANYNLPNEIAFISQQDIDTGVNGWVARHKRPLLIPDIRIDPRAAYPELARKYGIVGYLGVPILLEDQLIGVVNISCKEPATYSPEEITLMLSFAEQAGIAIDHARRYNKAQNQAVQLEAEMNLRTADLETATARLKKLNEERQNAHRVAQENQQVLQLLHNLHESLLKQETIYNIGRTTLHKMQLFIPFAHAIFFRVDTTLNTIEIIATQMIDNRHMQIGNTQQLSLFPHYQRLTQGQIVTISALEQLDTPSATDKVWLKLGKNGYTLFPLRIQNTIVGAIQLDITQKDTLTPRHIRLLAQVSQALTLAINYLQPTTHPLIINKQDNSNKSRAISQLRTSLQIIQEVANAPELPSLFERIVNLVCARFGYYHAQVYTLDDGVLLIKEATGTAGNQLKAMNHAIPLTAKKSLVVQAVLTEAPVRVGNVRENSAWLPNDLLPDTKAELAIPIIWQKQILGVLDVQSDVVDGFDEDDELLLLNLCGQIALAIQTRQ